VNLDPELDAEEAPQATPAWSVTFSDMTLNMLCMFVLMLSFAHFRASEFGAVAGSVRAAFGAPTQRESGPLHMAAPKPAENSAAAVGVVPDTVDATSVEEVTAYLAQQGLDALIEVEDSARGVVVRVRDRALFDSGSATVRPDAGPLLDRVLELYRHFPGTLAVEGHSDDRPIATAQFPSNWELSAGRAASVLRYLVAAGVDSTRVHVAGYADLRPLAPNVDGAGRSRNRRVEFVFEPLGTRR
jgi:chemotaxis protein MotB